MRLEKVLFMQRVQLRAEGTVPGLRGLISGLRGPFLTLWAICRPLRMGAHEKLMGRAKDSQELPLAMPLFEMIKFCCHNDYLAILHFC